MYKKSVNDSLLQSYYELFQNSYLSLIQLHHEISSETGCNHIYF
jgi:hypothetical protein